MRHWSLPFLVAWVVPAVGLFVAYLAVGASVYAAAIGGVLGGTIGPGGAALAMLVQRFQTRRANEADLDEALEWLRQAQESDYDEPTEHEGLRRLHEDLRRDEEQHE